MQKRRVVVAAPAAPRIASAAGAPRRTGAAAAAAAAPTSVYGASSSGSRRGSAARQPVQPQVQAQLKAKPQPQTPQHGRSQAQTATRPAEDDYEDDFEVEDYADDFEAAEEDEDSRQPPAEITTQPGPTSKASAVSTQQLEEISRAVQEENVRVVRPSTARRVTTAVDQIGDSITAYPERRRTNDIEVPAQSATAAAFQRAAIQVKYQQAAAKAYERRRIRELVDLDSSHHELFELAPLSEYELYIRAFGRRNCSQAGAQTTDEQVEHEVQTDAQGLTTRWTQFPPHDLQGAGVDWRSPVALEELARLEAEEDLGRDRRHISSQMKGETSRLNQFIQRAAHLCLSLLAEDEHDRVAQRLDAPDRRPSGGQLPISDVIRLRGKLQDRRRVTCLGARSGRRTAVAYDITDESDVENVDPSHQIVVWDLSIPNETERALKAHGQVQALDFAVMDRLLIGGTSDGSVLVWDLDEEYLGKTAVRPPSFTTDALPAEQRHAAAIAAVMTVPAATSATTALTSEAAFQVVTVDEVGGLRTWTGMFAAKAQFEGSLTDLGMAPGARIKLAPSSQLQAFVQDSVEVVTCAALRPSQPVNAYLGTASGNIRHVARIGHTASPRNYSRGDLAYSAVTDLAFQHVDDRYFLATFADGGFCLFQTSLPEPLRRWTVGDMNKSLCGCAWLPQRSCAFVVGTEQHVHFWDLAKSDSKPVSSIDANGQLAISNGAMTTLITGCSGERSAGQVQMSHMGAAYAKAEAEADNSAFQSILRLT